MLDREAFTPFSFGEGASRRLAIFTDTWSIGATHCAGRALALLELRMAVATLVRRFTFAFDERKDAHGWSAKDWEMALKDGFVLLKGPMPAVVRRRN